MIKQDFKVDAIITDPPYNVSRENNFSTIGREIDFGDWDWGFDQTKWLTKINKILNPGASVIIFNDWKNMGDISRKLESLGFEIKDLIRWIKPAPMPRNTSRRYVSDAEYALWAVWPGDKWVFNKQEDVAYLRPEINGAPPMGAKRIHPTQKSSNSIQKLIEIHTNKGDIIFDPFSGSGEISFNAMELDRFFVGSEIDLTYFKKSIKRIDDSLVKPAINHLGNKFRMIKRLLASLPIKDIENFVDVFAGSSIVSASYKAANKYFINDGDRNLAKIIKLLITTDKNILIREVDKIVKKYKLDSIPYSDGYNKLKKHFNENRDDQMANYHLLVLVLFGFNQQIRFNSKGDFNIPPGKTQWTEYQKDKAKKFIDAFKDKHVEVSGKDFEVFVKEIIKNTNSKNTVFYFDPPYLITNATYNNSWTEEDEKRLLDTLDILNKEGYKWVLSNVISSKGLENKQLNNFIKKNKLNPEMVNLNYSNSNYQRKKYAGKDEEIILRNFK